MLKADERIDQLYSQDIKIIQSPSVFSFSLDAVLLADFAVVKPRSRSVDLCAGNGAVSLFLSRKTAGPIAAVELQPRLADMAQRSVALNQLTDRITVHQLDLKDTFSQIAKDSVDVVTCNPPYFPPLATSKKNPNPYLAIARHEITTSLEEILKITSGLLKMNGKAFFVYRPDRFNEFITKAAAWRLQTKRVRFIHPKADREANMVLIELIKDGRPGGQRFLPPLTVYDQNNQYLPEVRRLLYGDN